MVIVWRCARPCVIAIMFSLRVSAQRAGRPSRRAAQQTTACSGSAPNLAPNAPPTSGVMIRRLAGSIASILARAPRVPCAPWFGIQAVSRPSSPQAAAAARVSIGAGATRWLTMVRLTTTSQPSNRSARSAAASPNVAVDVRPGLGEQEAGRVVGRPGQVHHGGERVVVGADQLGAVANDPKVLLADEPTGNLDPPTAERVFEQLLSLVRRSGVAAVIATHNLDLAARMDRTLRLTEGLLVEEEVVVAKVATS